MNQLPESLTAEQIAQLDGEYALTASGNSELLTAWLVWALKNDYAPAWDAADSFVNRMGRAKFLRPIYRTMCETAAGCDRAKSIYAAAKPGYHPVSVVSVDRVFEAVEH